MKNETISAEPAVFEHMGESNTQANTDENYPVLHNVVAKIAEAGVALPLGNIYQ